MRSIGTLCALWRYPVKSLRGEALESVRIASGGIPGDRARALYVVGRHARIGKPFRGKEHRLLHTTYAEETAGAMAAAAGVSIEARDAPGEHCFDAAPISLVLDRWVAEVSEHLGEALDYRRWRPNLFVHANTAALSEGDLVGATLSLGGVQLRVRAQISRCVTTTYCVETGDVDPEVLGYVARERGNVLGVYCDVRAAGTVSVGDELFLRERATSRTTASSASI